MNALMNSGAVTIASLGSRNLRVADVLFLSASDEPLAVVGASTGS
jgi:hypothetical protein